VILSKLGVGTVDPQAPLDVIGRSAVRGSGTGSGGGGGFWFSDADDPTNCKSFVGRGDNSEDLVGLYSNNAWRLAIPDSSGYVGINNTAPANNLSVAGNASIGSGYATIPAPTNGLIVQGSVGLGVGSTSPISPLDFAQTFGNKMLLFPCYENNSYGFGIQADTIQMFAALGSDIAFGTGASENFTEFMRIKGASGFVGVGCTSPVSKLEIAGSLGVKVVSKSAAYTAADETVILVDASGGNVTIALPPASTVTGRVYYIKRTSGTGGTVTIDGDSSETIDGDPQRYLSYQYDCLQIVSFGSAWHIMAQI
jgi:hypothetical protein